MKTIALLLTIMLATVISRPQTLKEALEGIKLLKLNGFYSNDAGNAAVLFINLTNFVETPDHGATGVSFNISADLWDRVKDTHVSLDVQAEVIFHNSFFDSCDSYQWGKVVQDVTYKGGDKYLELWGFASKSHIYVDFHGSNFDTLFRPAFEEVCGKNTEVGKMGLEFLA
jgi:hypothetical protein